MKIPRNKNYTVRVDIKGTDKGWTFPNMMEFLSMKDFICMKFNCSESDLIIS